MLHCRGLKTLPASILCEIFEKVDSETLGSYVAMFKPIHINNTIYQVVLTLKYSSLIVTNPWNGLMWALSRNRKIVHPEMLPYYSYVTLGEFTNLLNTLNYRIFPDCPVKRQILFVLACEDTNGMEKRNIAMMFSYLLTSMPASIMRTVRKIYLSMSDFSELNIDFDVTSAIFWKINRQKHLFHSLDKLALVGPVNLSQPRLLTLSYRYRHFTNLRSLDLTYLGLSADLRHLKIPNTVVDLDLSHNVIQDLEGFLIPHQIKCVNLSHNHLVGTVSMPYIPSLKVLNLRKNSIQGVGYLSDSLEVLDISFNSIPRPDFKLPKSLRYLYTDMAQGYLMSESMRNQITEQRIKILHHITSNSINLMRYRYNDL